MAGLTEGAEVTDISTEPNLAEVIGAGNSTPDSIVENEFASQRLLRGRELANALRAEDGLPPLDDEADDPTPVELGDQLHKIAEQYHRAGPGQRSELWERYTDDIRSGLRAIGISGPLKPTAPAVPNENVEPMTWREQQTASAQVRAALRSSSMDLDPEARSRLAELVEVSGPGRSAALREASEMVRAARAATVEAQPWITHHGQPKHLHQYTRPDGVAVQVETDATGKKRETVLGNADELRQRALERRNQPPWGDDPSAVTVDDYRTWTMDQKLRFHREFPDLVYRMGGPAPKPARSTRRGRR